MIFRFYQSRHGIGYGADTRVHDFFKSDTTLKCPIHSDKCLANVGHILSTHFEVSVLYRVKQVFPPRHSAIDGPKTCIKLFDITCDEYE